MALITKKKQSILWNKPTIVGASILELSKLFMLEFPYNVMKKQTDWVLVHSDTDSFINKLKTKNFYADLEKNWISNIISTNQIFQQITDSTIDQSRKLS